MRLVFLQNLKLPSPPKTAKEKISNLRKFSLLVERILRCLILLKSQFMLVATTVEKQTTLRRKDAGKSWSSPNDLLQKRWKIRKLSLSIDKTKIQWWDTIGLIWLLQWPNPKPLILKILQNVLIDTVLSNRLNQHLVSIFHYDSEEVKIRALSKNL